MLDLWQSSTDLASQPQPNEGRQLPATFGDSFDAAWSQGQLASSSIKQLNARNAAIAEFSDQVKRAGGDVDGEYRSRLSTPGNEFGPGTVNPDPDGLDVANTALAKLKASNPNVPLAPLTEADIAKRAVGVSQSAIAADQSQGSRDQSFGSRAGSLLGGLASGVADPINIPLMAIAPEAEAGVLAHAGMFGAGAAVGQIANEAINRGYNQQVQPGYGAEQAVGNVVEAGLGGAVLGGGLRALGKALEHFTTRGAGTATKDAVNVLRSEAQIADSNVLPGVQGEAEHRIALGKSIDDILNGHAIDPQIAQAGRDVVERASQNPAFLPPHIDVAELGRISDEAALRARHTELEQHLAALPPGDATAADRLAHLAQVERELNERAPAAPAPATAEETGVTPQRFAAAYDKLKGAQGGFSAVMISDLARELNATTEATHDFLRVAARDGDVNLHPTNSVNMPQEVTDAALHIEGHEPLISAELTDQGRAKFSQPAPTPASRAPEPPAFVRSAAERKRLSDRRDQILVDTTPEKLREAAAPIEQRRVALNEQASITDRLREIEAARVQAQADRILNGAGAEPTFSRIPQSQPTLFDIHTGRIDALMDMREGARATAETSPELPFRVRGIQRGVEALAQLGGHDMPAEESEAIAERIMAAQTPEEARFILNQITDRPITLMATMPSPADFAAAAKEAEATAPRPATMTAPQVAEALASPEAADAMRADIERAIDMAAKSGKALQIPVGIDAEGNAIMGSATRAMTEIDSIKALADQIAQCALPMATRTEE